MRPILGLGKALAIYPESHWAKAWEKKKSNPVYGRVALSSEWAYVRTIDFTALGAS